MRTVRGVASVDMEEVQATSSLVQFELEHKLDCIMEYNRNSGRTIEAQIAVENTLKSVRHMIGDIHRFHFESLEGERNV